MSLFISLINHSLYFVKALVHGGLEKKVALYHTQSADCCSTLVGETGGGRFIRRVQDIGRQMDTRLSTCGREP